MATGFENVLGLPITRLILTWVLVFTIAYAALLKTKALGEDQKIIGVIAAVFGFLVVGFGSWVLGGFFETLFGFATFILAGMLVLILFIGLAGGDVGKTLGSGRSVAILSGIAVVIFLIASGLSRRLSSDLISSIFVIIVLVIAVMFVTGNSGGGH